MTMKALHVFPMFGPELTNGSEYYSYMLSKKLVEQGVQVDVVTTTSQRFHSQALFSLRWENEYKQRMENVDGIRVVRFPAAFHLPHAVGYAISTVLKHRWQQEEKSYGVMRRGSLRLADHFYQRAITRPALYDWLFLLGLGPWSFGLTQYLLRVLSNYDVVLTGFMPLSLLWLVTYLAHYFQKPVALLTLFHPDDIYHHHRVFYRCFEVADAILAQTQYSAALFRQFFPASHPVQVGAGVDEALFNSPDISGSRFREKHGLASLHLVLVVGRKEFSKRYDLAVEAVDKLVVTNKNVKLIMIGSDMDRKPILSPNVLYIGSVPRSELLDAYEACDVLVMPSEHESFGMVLLEAWMRKKPVIGNALCQPVASIICDGEDGFLCATASEISARLEQLLNDLSLARRLGECGYRKVKDNYTWDVIGRKTHNLYQQLAKRA